MNARPRAQPSLSARLIATLVGLILITTAATGVPAYWLIRTELEKQARARVLDAGHTTQALLEIERARLASLATLIAQRPTLQRLLREGDQQALPDFLRTLQGSVGLDVLAVTNAAGQQTGANPPLPPQSIEFPAGFSRLAWPSDEPQILLLASQPVIDEVSGEWLGMVTVGIVMDSAFARQLAEQTGAEQSITINGRWVATSLAGAENSPATARAGEVTSMQVSGSNYYATASDLRGTRGEIIGQIEAALPVDALLTVERDALLALAISTLSIASLGSLAGAALARRIIAPLRVLTAAALNMGRGDLATPIPVPPQPAEIATLAAALENSRARIQLSLEEISQAREWSEGLIQSLVEGVVTFDTAGRITFFSQGAEHITGWESDQATGQLLNAVFKLSDCAEGQFLDQIPPRGGKREIRVLARGGRPVTLAITGARLIPPAGDQPQVALVLRDVTEEEAGRQLRAYFLANITHEFRTPLSALSASMELLADEAEALDAPGLRELVGSVQLSVINLQTLIDNLLESSSIAAGRFTVRPHPCELNSIAARAIQMVQPLLARRGQSLSMSEPTRLPPLYADSTRLTQVLVNLISNASKYSPPGQPIDLMIEAGESDVRIAVADRGPGIPAAERAGLFQRFVRLGTGGSEQYGIGLGLSVVKAIIEGHGGQVGVSDRAGGGSVFWVSLPLRPEGNL